MKLIAINTIGLTGAEILCAELARHPEIRMLPGQNFIRFKNSVYRIHNYEGTGADEAFELLSSHEYTSSGKCWAGLTKSMSPEMREKYSRDKHKLAFANAYTSATATAFSDAVQLYLTAYYSSRGEDISKALYGGWFGNNIIINSIGYPEFGRNAVVINFSNPVDYWLANINQRFVWNNLETIKFWIVNELYVRYYARNSNAKDFTTIDVRDYARDRDGVSKRLRSFLELPAETPLPDQAPDGFISFNTALVDKIEQDALSLTPVYKDHALYKAAASMNEWADEFLSKAENVALLQKYRDFWNTTSHTNLDWVGPVENEIVDAAVQLAGVKTERNLSCWFYHDCFELSCDHYANPRSKIEHYLGCLEDEIQLPALAYYARIAVCYIESIIDNCRRRPYSAFPIRQTSLYRRLTHPSYARFFPLWAMTAKIEAMEQSIDDTEKLMAAYHPLTRHSAT